jgi:hypothetical protein
MKSSLFGHLALNFATHPENLATEALAYILNQSRVARDALNRFCESTGAEIPADLFFQTQVADGDGAIPDLVGASPDNSQAVIIEAKFWAGLTGHQPVTYLNRKPALLLFLAPAKRLSTLWPELLLRCTQAGFSRQSVRQVQGELLVVQLTETQFMAATSWRRLLGVLIEALASSGDQETVGDAHQLQGLCNQMDAEAFLPLRSEELSPAIATRLLQLNDVVNETTEELVRQGRVSIGGYRATPTYEGFVRYMRLDEFGLALQVNAAYWSTTRETPLWLSIKGIPATGNWIFSPEAQQRLASLERESPPRLIRKADELLVPLTLPLGVEKDKVLKSVIEQLGEVEKLLKTVSVS